MSRREIAWTDVDADYIGKRLTWETTNGAVASGILTGYSQARFKPFMVTFQFQDHKPLVFEPPRKRALGGMTKGTLIPAHIWVHED